MMYLVAVFDKNDFEDVDKVEVAGIFDTEEKANKAKEMLEGWLEEDEVEDKEVCICHYELNYLKWYALYGVKF